MRASHQVRPETLLAAVVAFPAGVVILPPTVLTQEERPFQPPFLASAYRQSCSGTSRSGFFPSGAYVQHTPVWCPPTSFRWCSPASGQEHTRCARRSASGTATGRPPPGNRPRPHGSSPGWNRRYPP